MLARTENPRPKTRCVLSQSFTDCELPALLNNTGPLTLMPFFGVFLASSVSEFLCDYKHQIK